MVECGGFSAAQGELGIGQSTISTQMAKLETHGEQTSLPVTADEMELFYAHLEGTLVQIGIGGEVALPVNLLVSKEIRLLGAFRFDSEYALAARLLSEGAIKVRPIITASFPVAQAVEAFQTASQRTQQTKVQIVFP